MQAGPIRLPFVSGALPSGAAMLAIRVVVGPMLAYHGWKKIDGGIEKFVGTVARDGFPLPELLARATIAIELVGGICLTIGLLTRLWSGLATLQFLLIIAKVKWGVGVFGVAGRSGFELDLLYAVTATALLLAGPGLLAVDHILGVEADPNRSRDDAATVRTEVRSGG
jgi:putative oxidoreductase